MKYKKYTIYAFSIYSLIFGIVLRKRLKLIEAGFGPFLSLFEVLPSFGKLLYYLSVVFKYLLKKSISQLCKGMKSLSKKSIFKFEFKIFWKLLNQKFVPSKTKQQMTFIWKTDPPPSIRKIYFLFFQHEINNNNGFFKAFKEACQNKQTHLLPQIVRQNKALLYLKLC